MDKKYKILSSLFLITLIFLAFTPPLNPPAGGWTQQFMPDLGGRQISDIFFLDSLNGWAVTPYVGMNDTAYVLRTTNAGTNWSKQFIRTGQFVGYNKVKFLNVLTGYICGTSNFPTNTSIQKTTNGGQNWINIPPPDVSATYYDISILSNDTFWVADIDGLTGGVYRTINGGVNWDRQYNGNNPNKIYMFDRNLGFISPPSTGALYRTTNSGLNWNMVTGAEGFNDIKFIDNLTGWKARGQIKKTTDGGLNWIQQTMPFGGIISSNGMTRFTVFNRDTLLGCGGWVQYPNGQYRGILYRTIIGGLNWEFQIPDTTIHIASYQFINFTGKKHGWVYSNYPTYVTGIHTTTGGDPVWYTGVQQINSEIPKQFKLYQNYPNPFNPRTVIPYSLSASAHVKIIAYDITGKEVQRMADNFEQAGAYEVDFMGKFTASGVYFYRMTVDDRVVDTKKMILLK